MSATMNPPQFLYETDAPAGSVDSRPCFSPDGQEVLFMREEGQNGPAGLWIGPSVPGSGKEPQRLFPKETPTPSCSATRPDWSWVNDKIAFSGAQLRADGTVARGLFILKSQGESRVLVHVPIDRDDQGGIQYPTWAPDGIHIAVTNYENYQILLVDRTLAPRPQPGVPLTNPDAILAGMSSVNPLDADQICMAAQLPSGSNYKQKLNDIWIQAKDQKPYPIIENAKLIGRTPWWCPHAPLIVFESDLLRRQEGYSIYVYRCASQSLTPVTPLKGWRCSHAKWHPTIPTRLVLAATQYTGDDQILKRGIAILDMNPSVVEG